MADFNFIGEDDDDYLGHQHTSNLYWFYSTFDKVKETVPDIFFRSAYLQEMLNDSLWIKNSIEIYKENILVRFNGIVLPWSSLHTHDDRTSQAEKELNAYVQAQTRVLTEKFFYLIK